jgi:ketosteroid isomerase-like protein
MSGAIHMNLPRFLPTFAAGLLGLLASVGAAAEPLTAQQQVFAVERAFAKSMADRDLQAFSALLSEEAIFFGSAAPHRGKDRVVAAWKEFFVGPKPPFSWEPDQVEVLESGTLALSSGPVRDPEGRLIARFNSIWRLEAPDTWRIIFDKGSPLSEKEQQ